MNKTYDLAARRLWKKLAAVRATLRNDERQIFDEVFSGPLEEVTAHQMNIESKAAKTARGARNQVTAHSIRTANSTAKSAKGARSQVTAHSMSVEKSTAKSARGAREAVRESVKSS